MKITILCSDHRHPVIDYLEVWRKSQSGVHDVQIVQKRADLVGGDILILVSCSEIISSIDRNKYQSSLVLHASDLPKGRGWSPHIWELLQGANSITVSLLEAEDRVDSGRIWGKVCIQIPKHALWNEINHLLFQAEISMIQYAVDNFGVCLPMEQLNEDKATYYPRRSPSESEIDPFKSIAEQFDQIRVCDPNRFPAFFAYLGEVFILKIEKKND